MPLIWLQSNDREIQNAHFERQLTYGAFKSCQIDRIYELKAQERHHKVVITSGKLKIYFKSRVCELGVCQWKNVSDTVDAVRYAKA